MQDLYFRIYMQLERDGAEVKDTISSFGMYCMENPFKPCSEVKEPSKRTWNDEHGDDEYISKDGLYMASYENKVKFGFKGDTFGANEKCKAFIEYLRKGMMKMYCEYNRIGRQHVRLKSIDPELYRDTDDGDILVLSITFKFNDPVSDVGPVKDLKGNVTNLI